MTDKDRMRRKQNADAEYRRTLRADVRVVGRLAKKAIATTRTDEQHATRIVRAMRQFKRAMKDASDAGLVVTTIDDEKNGIGVYIARQISPPRIPIAKTPKVL